MTKKEFAARLKELRARRSLTQEDLGEASDLSPDTIRRLEHGGFNPSLETLTKVAGGLGLTVDQLIKDSFDESDDLAALIRGLPAVERKIAASILGVLFVHTAGL